MGEISAETNLALLLVKSNMELQYQQYNRLLRSEKKADKKETEALSAGYKKALNDLYEVLTSLLEI